MDQFVWNDLWQIMKRAKVDSLCCLGYPDRVRKCKRFLTLCVVVILILGCFVYFIKPEYTLYGSIVSAIIEILKEYTPAFIPKEDNLKAIEKLAPRFEKILADAEECIDDRIGFLQIFYDFYFNIHTFHTPSFLFI